jgi:protein-S-isoprenylcysteine O-methyltransferase Ste14
MGTKTHEYSRLPSRPQLLLRNFLMTAFMAAILFGSAGRWDLPYFWLYLSLFVIFLTTAILTLEQGLLKERFRPAAEGSDNLRLLRIMAGIIFLVHWVIAGWDVGRSNSANVPPIVQAIAMLAFASGIATWGWAMQVNLFFSAAVRIQRDRDHHVITTGPYRFIRHPGYAAAVVLSLCSGLALGSWWSVLPCLLWTALFVRRAALEDRLLQAELTGYREYAGRVPYRLLPGVW